MSALLEVRDLDVAAGDEPPKSVLRSISLIIQPGEIYGIVGESGSGKSLLLQAILRLLNPPLSAVRGSVLFEGEDVLTKSERQLEAIRGGRIALMSSNPRQHLNPVLSVGRQIADVIEKHQEVARRDAVARAVDLLKAVGIPDPADRYHAYPHELSGGMCQRIIIAMGLANSPSLILADEPTSGLDVTISVQILDLMRDLVRDSGSSLLLVSRDLGVIANYCHRVAVMYAGEVVESADVLEFFDNPIHPYSRRLIRAARASRDSAGADVGHDRNRSPRSASGCRFAGRCPVAVDACRAADVPLSGPPDHPARCIRRDELLRGEIVA